eukprot:m.53745 g.53745  ORF g.53745 m.53745 type:complete len:71 (-) comp11058_c0_seq1:131-343(-)
MPQFIRVFVLPTPPQTRTCMSEFERDRDGKLLANINIASFVLEQVVSIVDKALPMLYQDELHQDSVHSCE